MRAIFTLGTSQPQRVYSCNFFLSFNHSSFRGFVTLNSEVVVFFFANNLTPTDEGKTKKLMDRKERIDPYSKTRSQKMGQRLGGPLGYG